MNANYIGFVRVGRLTRRLGAAAALLALAVCPAPAQTTLYVATTGNDANPGTSASAPLATLEGARSRIEAAVAATGLPPGGFVVQLAGGTYQRTAAFTLTAQDSGTAAAPTVYRNAPGQVVTLTQGTPLPPSSWSLVADAPTLARLAPAAQGHVYVTSAAAVGATHRGPYPTQFSGYSGIFDLFVDDQMRDLARYPKADAPDPFLHMQKVLDDGISSDGGADGPGTFQYYPADAAHVQSWLPELAAGGVWLNGYWRVAWETHAVKIGAVNTAAGTITTAVQVYGGIGSYFSSVVNGTRVGSGQEPYYVLNIPEELTRPGEWCLDFSTGNIYYWPVKPISQSTAFLADINAPLISDTGASYVTFRNLTLDGGYADGIDVTNANYVQIENCVVRNMINRGASISGGSNCGVADSQFSDLGQGGVFLHGGQRRTVWTDPSTAVASGHYVTNTEFHDFSRLVPIYTPAINIDYSNGVGYDDGIHISHNLIYNTPHVALLYKGDDNLIEDNEITNYCTTSNDMGGIYTFADPYGTGNVIRYNFLHDTLQGHGIYWDGTGHANDEAYGNVLYNMASLWTGVGFQFNGQAMHRVHNNLIIAPSTPQGVTSAMNGFSLTYHGPLNSSDVSAGIQWTTSYPGYDIENNAVVNTTSTTPYKLNYPSAANPLTQPYSASFTTLNDNPIYTLGQAGYSQQSLNTENFVTDSPDILALVPSDFNAHFPTIGLAKSLPAGLTDADLIPAGGLIAFPGGTTYNAATGVDIYSVRAGGTGFGGAASDTGHFTSATLSGGFTMVARVERLEQTNPGAQAGIAARESGAAAAAGVSVLVTPAEGAQLIVRPGTGAAPTVTTYPGIAAPCWLKLTHLGDAFTAYTSPDGATWTQLGSPISASLAPSLLVGLAASASAPLGMTQATFTNVSTAILRPVYQVNAGGPAITPFAADAEFTGGNTNSTGSAISVTAPGAAPAAVYQTGRYGSFSYTFPGLTPGAAYLLRLHFAETYWNQAGKRIFNVTINGAPALTSFDIFAAAGAEFRAVVETVPATADSSGKVTVSFAHATGSPDGNALVAGLEVLAAAPPVYQVNAGGPAITPFAADAEFSGGSTNSTGSAINAGAPGAAPMAVYQTGRYGSFSYAFPGLTPGAPYLLRLHFAETYWNQAGKRVQNVTVNGAPALTNFDIFAAAGGEFRAVVETVPATADSSGKVTVSFAHATGSPDGNALVAGLEVLPTAVPPTQ